MNTRNKSGMQVVLLLVLVLLNSLNQRLRCKNWLAAAAAKETNCQFHTDRWMIKQVEVITPHNCKLVLGVLRWSHHLGRIFRHFLLRKAIAASDHRSFTFISRWAAETYVSKLHIILYFVFCHQRSFNFHVKSVQIKEISFFCCKLVQYLMVTEHNLASRKITISKFHELNLFFN